MNMKSFDTPILFLIFNRPETTRRVFAEIRKARPTELFIAADGPRKGVASDMERCKEAREIVAAIDWPCEVKTLFRGENLGCKVAVGGAITWFFTQVQEGIILEDDCLPDPSFFPFCQELLARYRTNEQVMMISGSNLAGSWKTSASYIYSKYANIWGWATWARAWRSYDGRMLSWKDPADRKLVEERIADNRQWKTKAWAYERIFTGKKDSWAYPWEYAMLRAGGLSIVPKYNLVENIGFGRGATNTGGGNKGLDIPGRAISFPLRHEGRLSPEDNYDDLFMKKAFGRRDSLTELARSAAKKIVFRIIPGIVENIKLVAGRARGVRSIRPNPRLPNYYLIKGDPAVLSAIVDVGCGFDADLSMWMVKDHGIKAFGIDPTLKHKAGLEKLSRESNGQFVHIPAAVSYENGRLTFNESVNNVSGSLLSEHRNINNQETNRYEVESVNLASLPRRLGLDMIEYIKLDLEGAEYRLVAELKPTDLNKYGQMFIEFHHHAVPKFTRGDTTVAVRKIESFGFKSFTINGNDYLFYR